MRRTRTVRSSTSLLAALLAAFLVPATAVAQGTAAPDSSSRIARGAELFSRNCQRCHNPRGPAEWNDREWVIIMQHMASRANITGDRIRLIRSFLLASNEAARSPGRTRGPAEALDPADIDDEMLAEGKRVYRTSGGCAACHGTDLGGGPIAPNLTDDRWRSGDGSLAAILEVVRNGVEGTAMAAYPGGIDEEMARAVAAYVWSVSRGRAEP